MMDLDDGTLVQIVRVGESQWQAMPLGNFLQRQQPQQQLVPQH